MTDFEVLRMAILRGVREYLNLYWGKNRDFIARLLTGSKGYQRALRLQYYVEGLNVSREEDQLKLIASVSGIKLTGSTLLASKIESSIKSQIALYKREHPNVDAFTFCDSHKFSATTLAAMEIRLQRYFDGEKQPRSESVDVSSDVCMKTFSFRQYGK